MTVAEKKAPKTYNGQPIPPGHRVLRGKLIPTGTRRPVNVLLGEKEAKLAKLDEDYLARREKMINEIESFKAKYHRAALAAELLNGRNQEDVLTEFDEQIKALQAKRRAVRAARV